MNEDDLIRTGVLGRPQRVHSTLYEPLTRTEELIWGVGSRRDPFSGRVLESGSGCGSLDEQVARFAREKAAEDDRPRSGESCRYSGRPFDCSIGALPKSVQTEKFFAELPAAEQARWFARASALASTATEGNA